MPTTPIYGFNTPAYGDDPDGPAAFATLAEEIETTIKALSDQVVALTDSLAAEQAARIAGDAFGTWTNLPTLITDIVPYSPVGSGYAQPGYKIERGHVSFRGLLKTNILRSATLAICTMPVGARPSRDTIHEGNANVTMVSGAASAGTAHTHSQTYQQALRMDVTAAGVFSLSLASNQDLPAGAFFSIEDIGYDLV